MARKPIVPIFATAEPTPSIPVFAGDGAPVKKSKPPPLPLPVQAVGSGYAWHFAAALVLLLIILVTYANSFQSEWVLDNKYIIELDPRTKSVQWDDLPGVAAKPGVRNIFTQDYWWPKGISGLYRPLTSFTYWLNWTAFGNGNNPTPREQVIGFHWVNLGVHFLNAVLFYALMLRLTRRFWVSFFAAAIFSTHPIATESVSNIIGRADMFATTAIIGGLLLYMNAVRSMGWVRVGWLIALLFMMAFGVFSKESAGALVIVTFLYDVIYRLGDRIREIHWREVIFAASRLLVTIPLMIFFAACTYLLVLVPWMGDMADVPTNYSYSTSTSAADPGQGRLKLDHVNLANATALYMSQAQNNEKPAAADLDQRIDSSGNFDGKIKLVKAADNSQWALFKATGRVGGSGSWHTLSLRYLDGKGSFTEGDGVTLFFVDSRFPWALTGTMIGLVLVFVSTALLAMRRRWYISVALAGVGMLLLLSMGLSYQPKSETQPPGAGLALFQLHLADNPGTPQGIQAAEKAASTHVANPFLLQIRSVSLVGLVIFTIFFIVVEAGFRYLWPEPGEDDPAAKKWRGFFDGYYVMASVAVLLFTVRDWVFANTTPAEQPFLDNPLRGLSFFPARFTAAKVWAMLLWKLVWPITLSSDYSYNQIPLFGYPGVGAFENMECILSLLLFVAIGALAIWAWKKGQKAVCFFILLYYINYIPTSNFLNIIGSIMAERFMYLPLVGFAAVLVVGVDVLSRHLIGGMDDDDTMLPPTQNDSAAEDAHVTPLWPTRSLYRYLPHVALCVLCVLYGVRSFYRNYDWHTDVTLWTSAQKLSPMSFRSYQSLAFALFEQDAAGNVDRMINIDEQGLKIVDDLPNPNNSSRLYLHLGMYYGLKGELLSVPSSQGGLAVTDAARPWFIKSAEILERGVPIDRAFNEVNRARDVKRGHNGADTPDVGLAPVYGYLGVAYMRLGLLDQAERTFRYMRHLEPGDPDGYYKTASLQVQRGKLEEAASSLIQVILLDSTRNDAWQLLNEVFKQINKEPQPCIVVTAQGRAQLDLSRVAVQSAVREAYRGFVIEFMLANQRKRAEAARDMAISVYHFQPELFNDLFDPNYLKIFPTPVPADPVYYDPPDVRFELMMPEVQQAFKDAGGGEDFTDKKLHERIVDGRAQYFIDVPVTGQLRRILVSEEGKLLSEDPVK